MFSGVWARAFAGGPAGVELLDVVLGRGGEAELVAHEILEHRACVATNGSVRFVGDDEVEVGRGKLLVLVAVEQALHRGDNDLGLAPVVAVFLVNGGLVVVLEQEDESLVGLVFQLQTVHQKQHAAGIAGAQEKLDDGSGGERLAGAGGHFKQEAGSATFHRKLDGLGRALLVGAQEAQALLLHEAGALGLVFPAGFGVVSGHLRAGDVVERHVLREQARGLGLEAGVALDGVGRGEGGDELWVALAQVPQVVQVAVAQDDEAAVLRPGVFAGLLFADERILALGLGFEHHEGKALFVEQQKVDEAFAAGFEVFAHGIDLRLGELDIRLQNHIGAAPFIVKKTPAGCFEQLVDLDPRLGFFCGHAGIVPGQ